MHPVIGRAFSPWSVALSAPRALPWAGIGTRRWRLRPIRPGVDFWRASQLRLFLKRTHYRELDGLAAVSEQEREEGDGGDEVADGLVGGLGVGDGYVGGAGGEGDGYKPVFSLEAGGDGGSAVGEEPGRVVAEVEDQG